MNSQLFTQSTGLDGYKERPAVDRDVVAINYSAPHTSIDAGLDALPKSGKQRLRVFTLIQQYDAYYGITADEIAQITGLPIQSISARINGLAKDQLIADSGIRRLTRNNRKAIAWIVKI